MSKLSTAGTVAKNTVKHNVTTSNILGVSVGMTAGCLSWNLNHSILWAIFHFFFGYLYIPYFFLEDTGMYNHIISFLK